MPVMVMVAGSARRNASDHCVAFRVDGDSRYQSNAIASLAAGIFYTWFADGKFGTPYKHTHRGSFCTHAAYTRPSRDSTDDSLSSAGKAKSLWSHLAPVIGQCARDLLNNQSFPMASLWLWACMRLGRARTHTHTHTPHTCFAMLNLICIEELIFAHAK